MHNRVGLLISGNCKMKDLCVRFGIIWEWDLQFVSHNKNGSDAKSILILFVSVNIWAIADTFTPASILKGFHHIIRCLLRLICFFSKRIGSFEEIPDFVFGLFDPVKLSLAPKLSFNAVHSKESTMVSSRRYWHILCNSSFSMLMTRSRS